MSRAKRKMYVEKYYDLEEEEMQEIINRAKKGDGSAQLQLLEIFDNFLTKYITMLYDGKFSLGDYDIRRFVCLFVKDKVLRTAVSRRKMSPDQRRAVHKIMHGIRYMILRYCDYEDVEQTVQMTFLYCVDVYERMESKQGGWVPFSGYLYSYFFYILKKNVEEMLIDQTGRKSFPLITHEQASSDEQTPGFTAPPEPATEDITFIAEIDDMWVAGEGAYFPFDQLTVQERQMLKWKYSNGDKTSEIASRLSEHPNTVRERFKTIETKLEEAKG